MTDRRVGAREDVCLRFGTGFPEIQYDVESLVDLREGLGVEPAAVEEKGADGVSLRRAGGPGGGVPRRPSVYRIRRARFQFAVAAAPFVLWTDMSDDMGERMMSSGCPLGDANSRFR